MDGTQNYRHRRTSQLGVEIVKTGGFSQFQILMLALEEKGIISEQEVEKVAKRLVDSFRLKNILSPDELKEVRKALRKMKLPDPLGVKATAYSTYMYKIKDTRLKVLLPDAGQTVYSVPDEVI